MSDRVALLLAGIGSLGSAFTLVFAVPPPAPLWVQVVTGVCAALGTGALFRTMWRG